MNRRSWVLFVLFAVLASALRWANAWFPGDIWIALCFWTGAHASSSPLRTRIPIIALVAALYSTQDILFQLTHGLSPVYPGMTMNHIAMIGSLLVGMVLPSAMTTRYFGVVGLTSSVLLFFLVSNFGVFISSHLYPLTIDGCLACYMAGIPFVKVQYLSNMAGSFAIACVHWCVESLNRPSYAAHPSRYWHR